MRFLPYSFVSRKLVDSLQFQVKTFENDIESVTLRTNSDNVDLFAEGIINSLVKSMYRGALCHNCFSKHESGMIIKYIGARYHIENEDLAISLYYKQAVNFGWPLLKTGINQL